MRSFLDAKAMAKTLRQELKTHKIDLGHSECLELVAKQFGFRDWNTLAAALSENPLSKHEQSFLPDGWELSGEQKWLFDAGVTTRGGPNEENALWVRSRPDKVVQHSDWCCIYPKIFSAEQFRGKTVEFSASVRCKNLEGFAYLWIRIENELRDRIVHVGRWEVPEEDVLSGTQDWKKQSIRVQVPDEASAIYFGVTLHGSGSVWLANVTFAESRGPDTRLRMQIPKSPQNLELKLA